MSGAARRERDLNDAQNEHVRGLVRELLRTRSQVELAPVLGMKQPSLSGFLGGRQGTSYAVARRAARLAGLDVEDVLAGRIGPVDPYPARARAIAFAGSDIHPQALEIVRTMSPANAPDLSALDWLRLLLTWDDLARRGALP